MGEEKQREHKHASSKRPADEPTVTAAQPVSNSSTRASHRERPDGREKDDVRHASSSSKVQEPVRHASSSSKMQAHSSSRSGKSSISANPPRPAEGAASRRSSEGDTRPDYRSLLIELYKKYKPEKVEEVDAILAQNSGNEADMWRR